MFCWRALHFFFKVENSLVSFLGPLSVFLKVVPPRSIERPRSLGQYYFSETCNVNSMKPFKHEKVCMLTIKLSFEKSVDASVFANQQDKG